MIIWLCIEIACLAQTTLFFFLLKENCLNEIMHLNEKVNKMHNKLSLHYINIYITNFIYMLIIIAHNNYNKNVNVHVTMSL